MSAFPYPRRPCSPVIVLDPAVIYSGVVLCFRWSVISSIPAVPMEWPDSFLFLATDVPAGKDTGAGHHLKQLVPSSSRPAFL